MISAPIEPLSPTKSELSRLEDKACDLIAESAGLTGGLHPVTLNQIRDLLRIINSYYSNLIEGHNTHPIDIQSAMDKDYSEDPAKRALQEESLAHIEVQKEIECMLASSPGINIASRRFLSGIHRSFYEKIPETLCYLEDRESGEKVKVVPGEFRRRDVAVGRHVAPDPDHLDAYMRRFEHFYDPSVFTKARWIAMAGAAHHRFLWIHPFMDGNGRVARLFLDAWMMRSGVVGHGVWCASRGLARSMGRYKSMLNYADSPRQGSFDGRGALSSRALSDFCDFILEICLDQVRYMNSVLMLAALEDRILGYFEDLSRGRLMESRVMNSIKPEASRMIIETLKRGEVARGKALEIMGFSERTARYQLSYLIENGFLTSDTPKGPVKLKIPVFAASKWFPDLYPENLVFVNSLGNLKQRAAEKRSRHPKP